MGAEVLVAILAGVFAVIAAILGALVSTNRLIFTDFFRWRRKLPSGFVVVINGASGAGKTSVAWALSRKYNIPTVFSTDIVREALRYGVGASSDAERAVLLNSSFLAHKKLSESVSKNPSSAIIEGYRRQCDVMLGSILRVMSRIRGKRDPTIIEGVNIIASQVFSEIPNDPLNRILFINLYIESVEIHTNRLRRRGAESGETGELTDRYILNIEAIREIDRFLKGDSIPLTQVADDSPSNIVAIENSGTLSSTVNKIDRQLKAKLKALS